MQDPRSVLGSALLGLLAAAGLGCFGYANVKGDRSDHPIVNHGTGATILYPGQGPSMPSTPRPGGAVYNGVPQTRSQSGSPPARAAQGQRAASAPGQMARGSASNAPGAIPGQVVDPGNRQLTFLGGTERDEDEYREFRSEPPYLKYLALPFAIAAYPFKAVADAVDGDDGPPPASAPTPASKAAASATAPANAPVDADAAHERARLEALERELASRGATSPPQTPPATTAARSGSAPLQRAARQGAAPQTAAPAAGVSHGLSIAQELAALRSPGESRSARPSAARATSSPAPGTRRQPSQAPLGAADQVRDRDGDGRPDRWVYHEQGRSARELLDEDGDGRPDRTAWLDPASGELRRVEEDTNLDGQPDSWIAYRAGQIARQRRDTDHDGFLDAWSFYRDGVLIREERDLDGDGFRDRVALYREGRLLEEREERDADGRVDQVTHYDAQERIARRDEDRDGDGLIDVRSFYTAGKLSRRELVENPSEAIEEDELASSAWSAGEAKAAEEAR